MSVGAETYINGQMSDFGLPSSTPEENTDTIDSSIKTVPTIRDIEIYGTNVIKPAVVLSKMQLHKGDPFDADMVQRDLKNVYELLFFI